MSARPSRRGLLALAPALAALAPASVASAAPHPDAELLAAVARFRALNRLHSDICKLEDEDALARFDEEHDDEQERLIDAMVEARATTTAGIIARGLALAEWYPERLNPARSPDWDGAQLAALLRDLVALAGPEPAG
jgi:hypothetical protein